MCSSDLVIRQKDGGYTGVIEVKPIEFNMLSEFKQNYFIDVVISNILKNVGIFQEINIVKLERPVIFDNYITGELTKIQELIEANENKQLKDESLSR